MKHYNLAIALFWVLSSSCNLIGWERLPGDGHVITKARSVGAFQSVSVSGAINLIVSNSNEQKVSVKVDENLQRYVLVSEEGGVLKVRTEGGYSLIPADKIEVFVSAPFFEKLDVSGACDIRSEGLLMNSGQLDMAISGAGSIDMELNAPKVVVDLSGSGHVRLKGETQNLKLDLSGAADAKCFDMLSEYTSIDISGAGSAEVFASVRLEAKVSGAGSVRYKGNPTFVTQKVSGAGSVSKVN